MFVFRATILILLIFLALSFVVSFVFSNLEMLKTTFDISIYYKIPIVKMTLSHTWEGVEFLHIVAVSILFGILVVAITTWGLDTKRKLKVRSLKKELQQLQQAVEQAKSSQQDHMQQQPQEMQEEIQPAESLPDEYMDSASATPEDITKSFEDAVEKGDFITPDAETPLKSREEQEETGRDAEEEDRTVSEEAFQEAEETFLSPSEEAEEQDTEQYDEHEDKLSADAFIEEDEEDQKTEPDSEAKSLPQDTSYEAVIVDQVSSSEEEETETQKLLDKKTPDEAHSTEHEVSAERID